MKLHPILAALRKHKAGTVLIALQIALTLAIVCNAVFIIGQRVERVNRPTGLYESNLFLVSQQWVGAPSADTPDGVAKLDAMQKEDLAALRNLPGVASVAPINSLPLLNSSWNGAVSAVVAAIEASTWASPSTDLRTVIPAAWRSPGSCAAMCFTSSAAASCGFSRGARWAAPAISADAARGSRATDAAPSSR